MCPHSRMLAVEVRFLHFLLNIDCILQPMYQVFHLLMNLFALLPYATLAEWDRYLLVSLLASVMIFLSSWISNSQ